MSRLLLVDPAGRVARAALDQARRTLLDPAAGPVGVPARTAVSSAAGGWTAWSVDSSVVGLGAEAADVDGVNELRVLRRGAAEPEVLVPAVTAFYLCPSPCGRYLSHLSPGPLGLELAVSEIASGELRVIERGQPLFWSWSADGEQLAVHVEDRVLTVDVAGGEPRQLTADADAFVAPWWMPDGSVVLVERERIVSYGPDGAVAELSAAGGGRFALDPDGRRLALVEAVEERPRLVVLDLLTGERELVADERTAAFFWSPEGRQLAVLVLGGREALQWLVADGQRTTRLAPFRPGVGWVREVLPFFEQYAQSHAVWSADGSSLVAPAVDADGSSEALVQHVDRALGDVHLPGARLVWWDGSDA